MDPYILALILWSAFNFLFSAYLIRVHQNLQTEVEELRKKTRSFFRSNRSKTWPP
jgi:hypothetical protein